MSQAFERHTVSFVLRIWREPMQEQGDRRLRGQLEHIGSGEKAYFQVPQAILSLLTDYMTEPDGPEAASAKLSDTTGMVSHDRDGAAEE